MSSPERLEVAEGLPSPVKRRLRHRRKAIFVPPVETPQSKELGHLLHMQCTLSTNIVSPRSKQRSLYFLRKLPLFKEFSAEVFRRIMAAMTQRFVQPGTKLWTDGQVVDAFYVIQRGKFREVPAEVEGKSAKKQFRTLGPRDTVNDIALILSNQTNPLDWNVEYLSSNRSAGVVYHITGELFRAIVTNAHKDFYASVKQFIGSLAEHYAWNGDLSELTRRWTEQSRLVGFTQGDMVVWSKYEDPESKQSQSASSASPSNSRTTSLLQSPSDSKTAPDTGMVKSPGRGRKRSFTSPLRVSDEDDGVCKFRAFPRFPPAQFSPAECDFCRRAVNPAAEEGCGCLTVDVVVDGKLAVSLFDVGGKPCAQREVVRYGAVCGRNAAMRLHAAGAGPTDPPIPPLSVVAQCPQTTLCLRLKLSDEIGCPFGCEGEGAGDGQCCGSATLLLRWIRDWYHYDGDVPSSQK